MPLKDIFKQKESSRVSNQIPPPVPSPPSSSPTPEFVFLRSDTHSRDVIHPPTGFPEEQKRPSSASSDTGPRSRAGAKHRFRDSLSFGHHRRSKSGSLTSVNIPKDLPSVATDASPGDTEAQWEERATKLVQSPGLQPSDSGRGRDSGPGTRSRSASVVSIKCDESIQEAIRLHEAEEYTRSTKMFGHLADPNGANNPLSQVLYGLALRHGWGIAKDPEKAVTYLQAAAQNSAAIEQEALHAGLKRGGKAKGELVLAIYELGNSYRQGWGVKKDPFAAREFYETAANLGDPDAQNEVGWCYLEGFGCKKDKKKAAKFYRMAEKQGSKTLGNTWIYKDKYMKD